MCYWQCLLRMARHDKNPNTHSNALRVWEPEKNLGKKINKSGPNFQLLTSTYPSTFCSCSPSPKESTLTAHPRNWVSSRMAWRKNFFSCPRQIPLKVEAGDNNFSQCHPVKTWLLKKQTLNFRTQNPSPLIHHSSSPSTTICLDEYNRGFYNLALQMEWGNEGISIKMILSIMAHKQRWNHQEDVYGWSNSHFTSSLFWRIHWTNQPFAVTSGGSVGS